MESAAVYVRWLALLGASLGLAACGGGGSSSGGQNNPPPASYTIGGTISGLTVAGLVLANGGTTITVNSGATTFSFATALASGTAYAVTVQTSPNGLTCSVANGTGTVATANVSNIVVTCSDKAYSVGGTISGLTSSGLVLSNGTDQLTVSSGATTFTMPNQVAFSSSYDVKVATQPQGLSCSVQNGTATMGAAAVTNIIVTCTDQKFTVGGSVSGLTASGLVLANGTDTVTVPANATAFTFPTSVAFGSSYAVTVSAQPTGLTCSVSSGTGHVPAGNVTTVQVACSNQSYSLGGTVSGLVSSGLSLTDGTDTVSVAANATGFTMPTSVAFQSHYAVTVAAQPTGATCSVSNGSGTMPASAVTSVMVTCATNSYTLGGTITGLSATGLVLTDGTDRLHVAANAAVFSMPTGVAYNSPYTVTVAIQPAGLMCTIAAGSATMPAGSVTSVQVSCSPRQWTWEGGPRIETAGNESGVYGTVGQAAPGNWPGARDSQMGWTDNTGRFWLFGGNAVDSAGNAGDMNDLWMYDPNAARWTWMSGSSTFGSEGTYGAVGSTGVPAARHSGMTWVDANGNLWLYGGSFSDPANGGQIVLLNDLWSYNISSGHWTLANGSSSTTPTQAAVYGAQGVLASSNTPGGRQGASTWVDSAGHLWLFGGLSADGAGHLEFFTDLWSFDQGAGQWKWVSGLQATNQEGTPSTSTVPPSRAFAASWVDGQGGLWLFGGGYTDAAGANPHALNDMWVYTPSNGQWRYVAGSTDANSTIGTPGIAGGANIPGARGSCVVWTDRAGQIWLFGGAGFGATLPAPGSLNDIWTFDPASAQWTYVSGPQDPNINAGVYVLPGNPGTSQPGARSTSVGWVDSTGGLWMFGGSGFDASNSGTAVDQNDLWMF
ncbi:MAG TPA: kelch repeat-containing protein [Steroidobacteraceae bacterium]